MNGATSVERESEDSFKPPVLFVRRAFWIELHDAVFAFAVQNASRDNGAVPRTLRSVFGPTFRFRTWRRSTTLTNSAARYASDHAPLRRLKIRKRSATARPFLPNEPPEIHEES
jgi:hypothetical protein